MAVLPLRGRRCIALRAEIPSVHFALEITPPRGASHSAFFTYLFLMPDRFRHARRFERIRRRADDLTAVGSSMTFFSLLLRFTLSERLLSGMHGKCTPPPHILTANRKRANHAGYPVCVLAICRGGYSHVPALLFPLHPSLQNRDMVPSIAFHDKPNLSPLMMPQYSMPYRSQCQAT